MRTACLLGLSCVLLATSLASAQGGGAGQIGGLVTNGSTGQPLPGANVTIQGTSIGVLAGSNGRYVLTGVPAGRHTVEATLLGYSQASEAVTVTAGATATADFRLEVEAVELAGLVAVGYGMQSRREVTGAVSQIRAQDVTQLVTSNPVDALKGRLPGVDITALSNEPGSADRIRIRGARSIVASNDPLIVVDGIPINGDLRDIDANSIQSIDVLKDAAAAAVYGNRGASGVLLVTTKRGIAGRTRIDYSVTYGLSQLARKLDIGTAAQFANARREAYRASGTTAQCADWVVQANPIRCDSVALGVQARSNLEAGVWTDWQDLVSRTAPVQNHQVAISGGDAKTRFRASIGYLDQTSITIAQGYTSKTGTLSATHDFGRLELHAGISAARGVRTVGMGAEVWTEALAVSPLGRHRDAQGNLVFLPIEQQELWVNPVVDAQNTAREITRTSLLGTINAALEVAPGLRLHVDFGPQHTTTAAGYFIGTYTYPNRGKAAPYAGRSSTNGEDYTLSTFLELDRRAGTDHRLQGTLLYEVAARRVDSVSARARDLPYSGQLWYDLGSGSDYTLTSRLTESALRSWLGRIHYTLKDRYTFSLSGRVDGSSVLAAGHKYAFFPAAAFAWRLGDEPFLERAPAVSNLKLRLSYGRVGNSAIKPYQTLGTLTQQWYSFADTMTETAALGYLPSTELPNRGLKWETTDKYNAGVDFGLLHDRLSGTVDVYRENTHDLLLPRALPFTTGYPNALFNVGSTRNRGVEAFLSTRNLESWHGLSWSTDLTLSLNRNRIVALSDGLQADIGSRRWVGQPINVNYGYKFIGIWQTADSALARPYGAQPGEVRVADLNGDGRINAEDYTFLGNHYNFPSGQGSLNNRFRFRNLDASVLATARWGFTVYDNFYGYDSRARNYWAPERASNDWPRPVLGDVKYGGSMAWRDASFVRIRDITLGYTLSPRLLAHIGAQRTRIYLRAQDPFLFTSLVGWDPEAGYAYGAVIDAGGSPAFRTFLIGVDAGF